jgi:hypothetical protein
MERKWQIPAKTLPRKGYFAAATPMKHFEGEATPAINAAKVASFKSTGSLWPEG